MANKLLQLLVQTGDVSDKFLPNLLPKAQKGKTVFSKQLIDYKIPSGYSNISNDNILSSKQLASEFTKQAQAKAEIANRKMLANRETVRSYDPEKENESLLSRLYHIAVNPMTALSYKTHGRDIPDHFERGEKNILETATNIINPFAAADAVSEIPGNLKKGQFLQAGLNSIAAIPWLEELRGAKSLAKEKGILKEVIDPETGESSFLNKPKPIVEPEVRFGRDDMGMYRRRGDSKTYILNNDGELGSTNAISLRHPGFLNETEYNQLQKLYTKPNTSRAALMKEYNRMNLITNDKGSIPVLEHHLSSGNKYNQFIENQAEKAFYLRDNPVSNEGWPQGYSINDTWGNGPSFADMYNNSLKRKLTVGLEKIDKSLGSLVPAKQAPKINYDELENAINQRLTKGMGIKKTGEPLSIKINVGSDNVMPNEFQTYIDGQRSGGIGLRQNMDAYSNNRKLSEILFPDANAAWRSTPGFRKTGDYPFNLTGKADDYYNKGLSGEFNAAINDVLKENGYGNILSGGTGHTPLGKARWENLVNKGIAEKFGEKYGESFYKLKAEGGPILDPRGQWAHPGKVTRIPSANITMQGVPYPVYGVGSNGQEQMMYPENHYDFGGASYVDEYPIMQNGGSLPQFQVAGWVQRAANAEYSCAANPRSNLREATEVTSGGKGDPYRDSKNERWKAQGSEWKNQGITKEDFNNAFNDSSRMGNSFMNPEYAKYFDPANGKVKPEYGSISNNLIPRVKYYAQAPGFPMGQRPTIQKILDFQMSQPGGLEGYRQLVKDDYPYNVNPFIPVKEDGGQHTNKYPILQNEGGTLPEVTVYGHRNPTAKAYFDRWRKEAESWQDREEPINTPMSKYLAAEQIYDKYKGKNINMIEKGTRPTFSPFSNTLNIVNPEEDYYGDSFIEELPHQLQKDKIGALKFATRHLTKDLWGTLKNISLSDTLNPDAWTRAYENNYFTPGTQEYEAHSIIEPKLKDEFQILADKEYNKLTANKNKMQKGGLTKKQPTAPVVNPYMDVDSQAADAFRSMIPLPGNASQMLAKVAFKDARMSNNSLTDEQKLILWNTIQNARKRSGVVNGGGTEYQDYGNQGYGTSDDFNDWFNRGKVGFIKGAYRSMTNPGFNLASTIGRGRYWQDPNNPDDVMYTDVYDWNPTESNFKGTNAYQLLRNQLRSGEDKNLNQQKNDNYRMNFKLSKKEIDEIQRRKDMAAQGSLGLGLFKNGGQNKQPLERKHNIKVIYK